MHEFRRMDGGGVDNDCSCVQKFDLLSSLRVSNA